MMVQLVLYAAKTLKGWVSLSSTHKQSESLVTDTLEVLKG